MGYKAPYAGVMEVEVHMAMCEECQSKVLDAGGENDDDMRFRDG